MRWKEINEAPLADFGTYGDLDKEGSFRSGDLRAMKNPKWVEKVERYLKKSPQNINLYLVNGDIKNRDYEERQKYGGVQSLSYVERLIGKKVPDAIDSITVVLMNNEGDERVGLTPWIVAHRIAHALLAPGASQTEIQRYVTSFVQTCNEFLGTMSSFLNRTQFGGGDNSGKDAFKRMSDMGIKGQVQLVGKVCKFKSAEAGHIERPGELFVELFTQYLVQGKVTFKRPDMDDRGRFQAPVLNDEETKLLDRAKRVGYQNHRGADGAAKEFADNVMYYNDKGKRLNPIMREPIPWFITQNESGEVMGSFSRKEAAEKSAEDHGLVAKEMQPTKASIAMWKKNLTRHQALIDLYIKFYNLGMLEFEYPRNKLTATDKFEKLADEQEEELNRAIHRILIRCIGRAILL